MTKKLEVKGKGKPLGESCKFNPSTVCFSTKTCEFPSIEECLRQALFLSQREVAHLKEKANLKHTRMSIKWRDQAFYYKKRVKFLEAYLKARGIEIPLVVEGLKPKNGGEDEGMVGDSQADSDLGSEVNPITSTK